MMMGTKSWLMMMMMMMMMMLLRMNSHQFCDDCFDYLGFDVMTLKMTDLDVVLIVPCTAMIQSHLLHHHQLHHHFHHLHLPHLADFHQNLFANVMM